MQVVEVCDDEETYWIKADSIEVAKQYYIENLAIDFETDVDTESLTCRFLRDDELDSFTVLDEDDGPEGAVKTFREAITADADLEEPYLVAQTLG